MLPLMFRTIWRMLLWLTLRCICCLILERATCDLEAKKVLVLSIDLIHLLPRGFSKWGPGGFEISYPGVRPKTNRDAPA